MFIVNQNVLKEKYVFTSVFAKMQVPLLHPLIRRACALVFSEKRLDSTDSSFCFENRGARVHFVNKRMALCSGYGQFEIPETLAFNSNTRHGHFELLH